MRALWILAAMLISGPSSAQLMFKCLGRSGETVITNHPCRFGGRILQRERADEQIATQDQLLADEESRRKSNSYRGRWSYPNEWNYSLPDGTIATPDEYRAGLKGTETVKQVRWEQQSVDVRQFMGDAAPSERVPRN